MKYTYFPTKDDRKEFIINVRTGKRIGAGYAILRFFVGLICLFIIFYCGLKIFRSSLIFLIACFALLFFIIRVIYFIISYFLAFARIRGTTLPDKIYIEISRDFIRKNDLVCNKMDIVDFEIYKHFIFLGKKDSLGISVICIPFYPNEHMKIEETLNGYGYIYKHSDNLPQIVISASKNQIKKKGIINNIFVLAYIAAAIIIICMISWNSYNIEQKTAERNEKLRQENNEYNNDNSYQNESDYTSDEEISENEKDIENGLYEIYSDYYLGKEGYSFTTTYDAKGVEQAIIYEDENTIRYITYDRFSKNEKCLLYVAYENEKDSDGSYAPADAKILDMYAYDLESGSVILSGKKGWADVGNKEYRAATGE